MGEHSALKYPRDSDSMPSLDFKLFKNLNERHIKFQMYIPHFFIRATSDVFFAASLTALGADLRTKLPLPFCADVRLL